MNGRYNETSGSLKELTDVSASVWLTDVYKELPLAQLHGFDKTTDGFPPREWLPGNICLKHLDIFQPIPESLVGQYDMVYIRLFMFVVQNDDPGPMLENIVRLLSKLAPSRTTLHGREFEYRLGQHPRTWHVGG